MPTGMQHMRLRGEDWAGLVVEGHRLPVPDSSLISLGAEGFFVSILQTGLSDVVPGFSLNDPLPQMQVRKRNGSLEAAEVNKIVRAVQRCCVGLSQVDPMRVASRTIDGLYDGATTRELDAVSIQTAASLIAEEPECSKLAARLLLATIAKEVSGQNVHSFSQSIALGIVRKLLPAALQNLFFPTRASSMTRSTMIFRIALNILGCVPCTTVASCGIPPVGK
jgi:hypothetical protein